MSDPKLAIIHNLLKMIKRKTDKISTLQIERSDLILKLQTECPHDNVKDDSKYESGDYYNYSTTNHKHVCQTCGKIIKEFTETHSWR
jgi:hypothetical protein